MSRTDDSETPGVRGASAEAGACSRRNLPRAGYSGAEGDALAPSLDSPGCSDGDESGQDFGEPNGAGKLKT